MFTATTLSDQFLACPCGSSNRLLYRFCRNCGLPNQQGEWPTRGGGWRCQPGALALGHALRSVRTPEPFHSLLAWGGVVLALTMSGSVWAFADTLERNMQFRLDLEGPILAAPALVNGLLLAAGNQGLQSFHLSRLLGIEPGRRLRDSLHPLPGPIQSDVVCDGARRAAFVSGGHLHVFEAAAQGLVPLWKVALASPGEVRLVFGETTLTCGSPAGELSTYQARDGRLLHQETLAEGLAPGGLLVRDQTLLIAGARGSLQRLELQPPWNWVSLVEPGDQLCFGFGASRSDALLSHGRKLRHVRLDSGRCFALEVPQHCVADPLVGEHSAILLSHEGTAYGLKLEGDTPRVVHSRKLFTSYEPVLAPPIVTARTLCLAGPDGELVTIGRPS